MSNVIVDDIFQSKHANQIHINLHLEEGFGHIGLFESNNIYWIEFEAIVGNFESYYKYLEIQTLPNLDEIE